MKRREVKEDDPRRINRNLAPQEPPSSQGLWAFSCIFRVGGWMITTTLPKSWLQNIKDQSWVELQHLDETFPLLVWLHICYDLLESVAKIKHIESPYVCGSTTLKTKITIPWKILTFTTIMYLHTVSIFASPPRNGNGFKCCIVRVTTRVLIMCLHVCSI